MCELSNTTHLSYTERQYNSDDDDDKVMEELFQEIVTPPCTTAGGKLQNISCWFVGRSDGVETGSGLEMIGCSERGKERKQRTI